MVRRGEDLQAALNAAHVTIRDSYISDCKGVGMDTQAIGGWNGPGPYGIENNYLKAAGENVLFGGTDPAIPNLVPDGIAFRRNHVSRSSSWRDPIIMTRRMATPPAPESRLRAAATDGTDIGADVGALLLRLNGVATGVMSLLPPANLRGMSNWPESGEVFAPSLRRCRTAVTISIPF